MYPILALQAIAVGLALLASCPPRPAAPARTEPQPAVPMPASLGTPGMRCRLYFGCMPAGITTQSRHG